MTTENTSATSSSDDLASELSSMFDEIEAGTDDKADADTPEVKDEKDEENEVPADDDADSDTDPDTDPEDKPEEKKEEPKVVVKAPNSWSAEMREKFAELPEDVRGEILRRENDVGRITREAAGARNVAENFLSTVKPFEETLQKAGVTPFQAVQETLAVAQKLMVGDARTKAEVLGDLFVQYDIDLDQLNEVLTARITAPKPTKAELQIQQQLAAIEQRLTAPKVPTAPVENPPEAVNTLINEFANNPKNEFFNDVHEDMVLLLNSGRASTLEDAYDKAVRLNDKVQKVIRDRKAKDAERLAAGKASVKGSSPKNKGTGKPALSERDELSRLFDEMNG